MSRTFTAQFTSTCPECGDEIVADIDTITMTDGGAMHTDCAPSEPEITALARGPLPKRKKGKRR